MHETYSPRYSKALVLLPSLRKSRPTVVSSSGFSGHSSSASMYTFSASSSLPVRSTEVSKQIKQIADWFKSKELSG